MFGHQLVETEIAGKEVEQIMVPLGLYGMRVSFQSNWDFSLPRIAYTAEVHNDMVSVDLKILKVGYLQQ